MNIAIYSRKSKFTGKGESIENQIDLCKEYALRQFGNNCEFKIYEDEGFSAKNTDRPMFQKLLSDIDILKFDVLMCYRLDRISRSVSDFSAILDMLQDRNINFISLRESFDTTTPMGRAMIYIASVFAQLERETIAERVRDNKTRLAHNGRWQGGLTPLGYLSKKQDSFDADGKKRTSYILIEDPETAPVVEQIYKKYIQFGSLAKVEQYMLQNRIPSAKGKEYHKTVIRQILTNPVYAVNTPGVYDYLNQQGISMVNDRNEYDGQHGLLGYNKTGSYGKNAKRKRQTQENWIIAVSDHKGIIDGDTWVKAQTLLKNNREKYPRWETSHVALLSGLLRCGKCGAPMKVLGNRNTADGNRNFYYACTRKARSKGVLCNVKNASGPKYDQAFVTRLREMLNNKGNNKSEVVKAKQKVASKITDTQKQIQRIEKSIADNERAIKNLVLRLSVSENTDMDQYIKDAINELSQKNASAKEQLSKLAIASNDAYAEEINLNLIMDYINIFLNNFDNKTLEEKRSILKNFVKSATWDGENSEITLYTDKVPVK